MTRRAGGALLLTLGLACVAAVAAQRAASAPGAPEWLRVELVPGAESTLALAEQLPTRGRVLDLQREGHGIVELLLRSELELRRDRTVVERTTVIRHFLQDEGVRNLGNLSVAVRGDLERLVVQQAWARLQPGSIRDVAPERVQVQNQQPNVFSDLFEVVVPYESLAPGATAVLVSERTFSLYDWPLPWSRVFMLQTVFPIERMEISVSWEEGVREPQWVTDSTDLECRRDGERRLTCRRVAIAALPIDPALASWQDRVPHLVLFEPHSWQDLSSIERTVVDRSMVRAPEIAATVGRLIGGVRDPAERVFRLYRFVADEIRYVAFEHGTGAVVPRPVDETLARRYGDCKDKVALFLALARQAGIHAYPVLVSTQRFSVDRLVAPSWSFFDHMVACLDGGDLFAGEEGASPGEICLELTTSDARAGVLPPSLYGAVALDLRAGAQAPRRLSEPKFVWIIEVDAAHEIACDGTTRQRLQRRFIGPGAVVVRGALRGLTEQARESWLIEDYRQVMGERAELQTIAASGMSPAEGEVELDATARYQGDGVLSGARHYRDLEPWLAHYAGSFVANNRHHPYVLPGVLIQSRVRFAFCPEVKVATPGARLDLESEFGRLTRHWTLAEGNSLAVTTLELPRRVIEVDEMDRFRRFLERALGQTMLQFGIADAAAGPTP